MAVNLVPDAETADENAFLEYYKASVSKDFYEELQALRKKTAIDPKSAAEYDKILNGALSAGANLYSKEEKEMLLRSDGN